MLKKICSIFMSLFIICFSFTNVSAQINEIKSGTYDVEASLSCYVNAMGGIEFGAPLLKSAKLTVNSDASKMLTIYFTKSNVTIYGVSCDTFIDASSTNSAENNGVANGTLGYYNENGVLVTDNVTYTQSDDTALNSRQEDVHYVDSMTFPIEYESSTYNLTLFVNSNVMGTQFSNDTYPAVLTVNWESLNLPEDDEYTDNISDNKTDTSDNEATDFTDDTLSDNGLNETDNSLYTASDEVAENSSSDTETQKDETAEEKSGMNIYYADETSASADSAANNNEKNYVEVIKNPAVLACGVSGGVMIVVGIIFIVIGKIEKNKKVENEGQTE